MAFLFPTLLPRVHAGGVRRPRQTTCATTPHETKSASTPPPSKATSAVSAGEKFLTSLGVSREHARRAVSRTPRLAAETDPEKTAAPVLTYLRELGLSDKQVGRALQHAPQMIFRSASEFRSRRALLRDVAHVPDAALPAAVARCPHILWMSVGPAQEVVRAVARACPALTKPALGGLLARVPQVLLGSAGEVESRVAVVRAAGVDEAGMGRVFVKAPLVLVYDVRGVQSRVRFLRGVGLSTEAVGRVLVATPEVLEKSVEKMLRPRVALLESLVGEDAVADVLDKVPSLFGGEDILDRVLWLRDVVGLSDEEVRAVVRRAPAVLTYSVEGNLAQKWEFLRGTMGATSEDVVALPRETLCANLQQRAMPRYAFLASSGMGDVPVQQVLRGSDAEFCRQVALCKTTTFRRFVDNDTYLLFFSTLM